MISSVDLKFDKMEVDTKLAQEYIKKNNAEFRCESSTTDKFIYDAAKNKIYCSNNVEVVKTTLDILSFNFVKLEKMILDNKELFCQLEYLIRQIPIETTKRELEMVAKHLCYRGTLGETAYFTYYAPLVMTNATPFIELGWFPLNADTAIIAAENTAVVCNLFADLCAKALDSPINLSFLKNQDVEYEYNWKDKAIHGGCVGVVTADSDVPSAVHALLNVPKGGIWGIRRILVQESVFEQFNTEFDYRTVSGSQDDVDPGLKAVCSAAVVYDGNTYVREYVGGDTDLRHVVNIESFRTTKELMTSLDGYRPFGVSLWSHGAALADEIAFGITAPVVWVNNFGSVRGPSSISLAYFTQADPLIGNPQLEKVRKLRNDWLKLTLKERREAVARTVARTTSDQDVNAFYLKHVYGKRFNNFVDVDAGEMVVWVRKPRDVYAMEWVPEQETMEYLLKQIAQITYGLCDGSGFLIRTYDGDFRHFKDFLTNGITEGLPIVLDDSKFLVDRLPLPVTSRLIYSNIGTVFAN